MHEIYTKLKRGRKIDRHTYRSTQLQLYSMKSNLQQMQIYYTRYCTTPLSTCMDMMLKSLVHLSISA